MAKRAFVVFLGKEKKTYRKIHSGMRERGGEKGSKRDRARDDRWEKRERRGPGSYLSPLSSHRHKKKRDQTTGSEHSLGFLRQT